MTIRLVCRRGLISPLDPTKLGEKGCKTKDTRRIIAVHPCITRMDNRSASFFLDIAQLMTPMNEAHIRRGPALLPQTAEIL